MVFHVSLTFALFFVCLLFLARTARAVNTTLRGAEQKIFLNIFLKKLGLLEAPLNREFKEYYGIFHFAFRYSLV